MHALTHRSSRDARVPLLLVVTAALGLVDLCLTYQLLASVGMFESNPVARAIIHRGPLALVSFKLALIAVNVGLIWVVRSRALGEFAAWSSLAVMVAVTVRWSAYHEALRGLDPGQFVEIARNSPEWVSFDGAPLESASPVNETATIELARRTEFSR